MKRIFATFSFNKKNDIMKWISNEEVITMNENLNINWASHIYAKSSLNPYKIRKLEK